MAKVSFGWAASVAACGVAAWLWMEAGRVPAARAQDANTPTQWQYAVYSQEGRKLVLRKGQEIVAVNDRDQWDQFRDKLSLGLSVNAVSDLESGILERMGQEGWELAGVTGERMYFKKKIR